MKVIICGSRTICKYDLIKEAVEKSGFEITEIVSGGARGVDFIGEVYAFQEKIPLKRFPADWNKHGKSAGFLRNKEMAEYVKPDGGVIALWDGVSAGTKHMLKIAKEMNLKIKLFIIKGDKHV